MDMKWMLHGMECAPIVMDPNLHHIVQVEVPADVHIFYSRLVSHDPPDFRTGCGPIHNGHGTRPFDRIEVDPVVVHRLLNC